MDQGERLRGPGPLATVYGDSILKVKKKKKEDMNIHFYVMGFQQNNLLFSYF